MYRSVGKFDSVEEELKKMEEILLFVWLESLKEVSLVSWSE